MGWKGESEYNCPECDGDGDTEEECSECGVTQELKCDNCLGTGWDPEKVDVAEFKRAAHALNERMKQAGCILLTCELIEGDQRLGRTSREYGSVRVADFLLTSEA